MAIIKVGAIVQSDVMLHETVTIGEYSIIGVSDEPNSITINKGTVIKRFCMIDKHVTIGENCCIGDGVYIYKDCKIGNNVYIEPKSMIQKECIIGNGCIIDGTVGNKVIMEDNVRFMGIIAHSHRNHTLDWKTTSEPSPTFRKNSFIGVGAIIIGNIEVGENSYVAAGEVLKYDLPKDMVFYNGQIIPKKSFRGFVI